MAEQINVDDPSWDEVKVTLLFSGVTAAIFLTVFEVSRRSPAVLAVFDRRRSTRPHRTPPPLLRNFIFEWLFLNNDPVYTEYSDISDMRDVLKQRRVQRLKLEKYKLKQGNNTSIKDPDSPKNNIISSEKSHHLTPNVILINNRRLPATIAKYAQANDLSDSELIQYENKLLHEERKEEIEFFKRSDKMIKKYGPQSNCFSSKSSRKQLSNVNFDVGSNDEYDKTNVKECDFPSNHQPLGLPSRPPRIFYLGFQSNGPSDVDKSNNTQPGSPSSSSSFRLWLKSSSPTSSSIRGWFSSSFTPSNNKTPTFLSHPASPNSSFFTDVNDPVYNNVKRHLRSTSVSEKRPLKVSDREMLRCIGLDTFVVIRFLRFCFDVTFYPFIVACIVLIPTYVTNDWDGIEIKDDGPIYTQTSGYFKFTINRLEPKSHKLWISLTYCFLFYIFILWRLWIEWETFITLRFDFLANGDRDLDEQSISSFKSRSLKQQKDDVQTHLEQYRNSCIVEYIPDSHRRDRELYDYFDAMFPNQVRRAEVLVNATPLEAMIRQRQLYIEKYENIYARHAYKKQKYNQKVAGLSVRNKGLSYYLCLKCLRGLSLQEPKDPIVVTKGCNICACCCNVSTKKALPYYYQQIHDLNRKIEKEHGRIMNEKEKAADEYAPGTMASTFTSIANVYVKGVDEELVSTTGFVEFKNITIKQSAIQCNLTGTNRYMKCSSAPDPRDIIWKNAAVERRIILVKKLQSDGLLFVGVLFWSVVVTAVSAVTDLNSIRRILPHWMIPEEDTFWYDLMQGYLPVLLLELLMLLFTILLNFVGKRFIRYKSYSEVHQFVFKWHFAYRTMNLIIIIVRNQLFQIINDLRISPQKVVDTLASSISNSSQFFLNNMIVAAGSEVFFELSQIPKIVYQLFLHQVINVDATSKRRLEKLKEPDSFEWGDKIPPFIFALLVACIYSTIVPIVIGACAVYFYFGTKVYTHQALYVYGQRYEGGGKLMYQLSRTVFSILYFSICIFSILLGLKSMRIAAIAFLVVMMVITVLVDKNITYLFVKPSLNLALSNARVIDEEIKIQKERDRLYEEYKKARAKKKKEDYTMLKLKKINKTIYETEGDDDGDTNASPNMSYMPSTLFAGSKITTNTSSNDSNNPSSDRERVSFSADVKILPSISSPRRRKKILTKDDDATLSQSENIEVVAGNSSDSDDFYLYRQPSLNKDLWETEPRAYWEDESNSC